ncbi:hypothetical protein ACNOYE_11730 [Nannocystaceae bacterium ST9]
MHVAVTFALTCWLGESSQPPAAEKPPAGSVAEADPASGYADAVAEVERLNLAVNRDPETNYPALAEAIERLTEFADELARDEQARQLRTLAQLNLARALLRADDEDGAGLVVDEAIRAAGDAEVPAGSFGPKLADFHAKRREALGEWGTGAIAVECSVACRVLIDEREVEDGATGLYFGTYRVWIAADDPTLVEDPSPARHEVIIDIDGEVETLRYEPAPKIVDEPEPIPEPPPPPPPPERLLPRWAEIVGLVAGASLIATGGILLSRDGHCIAGGALDPMSDAQQCPQLWESTPGGAATLALGAALAVTGGVMLAVDEVRVNGHKGQQAVLTWTLRF